MISRDVQLKASSLMSGLVYDNDWRIWKAQEKRPSSLPGALPLYYPEISASDRTQ